MGESVGDFVVRRLAEWGVRRVFGYPGDHEEIAALAACGHAKFTGEVGVCLATSGPGAIHLLNGPDVPYARYAELLGLGGIRVEAPDDIGPAWDEALAGERPVVLDVVVDPEVPPLPPHIGFEQAKAFMLSLAKGDPARGAMVARSLRETLAELLPRR
jgi:thiamine pyrophosphate-dependent acetolactate synthase large subunit-like protein